MNRFRRPTSSGWTILVVSAAALLLASCGRKGPLDLPPTSSAPPLASSAAPTDTAAEAANKPTVFGSSYGTDAPPTASRGTKKPFVLDPLLDSK